MKIREMMTRETRSVSPETPVIEAAGLMRLHDIGVVPVVEKDHVVGMLTDRDIVVQVVADGDDPRTTQARTAVLQRIDPGFEFVDAAHRERRLQQVRQEP